MKNLVRALFVVLAIICLSVPSYAGDKVITATWEQQVEDLPQLLKWTLHYGTTKGGPYTNLIDIAYDGTNGPFFTDEVIVVPDNAETTYYFMMTAWDKSGNESVPSDELSLDFDFLPPGAPFSIKITVKAQ